MNNMYKILPVFQRRIWGGKKLKEKFGYPIDFSPVGEAWLVADLPLGTNTVETTKQSLSDFYAQHRVDYFGISCDKLPIRATIIDPMDDLSVQLHPSNEYAMQTIGSLGKPEAWYIIEHDKDSVIQYGHHASTKEEFIKLVETGDWKKLLRYIPAVAEQFLYVDWGVLHAIGKGVLVFEIARNSDVTYRVYDYDRIDKQSGKLRDLHIQQALDNLKVPFNGQGLTKPDATIVGDCEVIEYYNVPGEFIFRRIRVKEHGKYHQKEFGFYTIGKGSGTINGTKVSLGDTYFVPLDHELIIEGRMDLLMASYGECND